MKFLLASDMDGTVIPLEDTPERRDAIATFSSLVAGHSELTLAYITGRHLDLALAGIDQWNLPRPEIIVGDVGTSVYWQQDGTYLRDNEYAGRMKQQLGGFTGNDVQSILRGCAELTIQEPECQSAYKTSYYVPLTVENQAISRSLVNRLETRGLSVNVIYSIDQHKQVGLIDVLPADVAKDYALRYLADRCGLAKNQVVYAGDSGNDLKAFLSGYPAIAVANTPGWVKEDVQGSDEARVYIAKEPSTAGVVEGCAHWGLF